MRLAVFVTMAVAVAVAVAVAAATVDLETKQESLHPLQEDKEVFITLSEGVNGPAVTAPVVTAPADAPISEPENTCIVKATESSPCISSNALTAVMKTNSKGIDLVKSFESFFPKFYIDPVGIKTIGYGYACHVNPCSGGIFDKGYITKAEAEQLLRQELGEAEVCVRKGLTAPVNPNQFSALVSFTFNAGCKAFSTSTLLRLLNQRNYAAVPQQLLRWNKGGGKVLQGLTRRRTAEGALFMDSRCSGSSTATTNLPGVCKDSKVCTGSTASGLCKGPSNIQCCFNEQAVDDTCTIDNQQQGTCTKTDKCKGNSYPGFCPGGRDVQCCIEVPNPQPADDVQSCVTSAGKVGRCQTVSSCKNENGDSVPRLCGDMPNDVQCCVSKSTPPLSPPPLECKSSHGLRGTCISQSECSKMSNMMTVAGLCAGPTNVQCCVQKPPPAPLAEISCVALGVQGKCMEASACTGTPIRGKCPGAADTQCCILKASTCTVMGQGGLCVPTSHCAGVKVAGYCSNSAADVQCCFADSIIGTLPEKCKSFDFGPEKTGDAWSKGKKIDQITTVMVQGQPMEKATACAFKIMEEAAKASRVTLTVKSAFRTYDEQKYLYGCYKSGKCNNGNLAAEPGFSNHQSGIAVDISVTVPATYNWLKTNADKYGFQRTVPSEKWHWEYKGSAARRTSYT